MESQKTKILNILEDKGWHCTNEFYASYMADPRKRLHELRQKFTLEWRWCEQHDHKGSKEWRLEPSQAQNSALLTHETPQKVFNPIQEVISALKEQTALFQ